MNESTMTSQQHEPGTHPDLPAPIRTTGAIAWMRHNLFSSPFNIILTLLAAWILWTIIPPVLNWVFVESILTADNRNDCWAQMSEPEAGACWAFIQQRLNLFTYGFYPQAERWRVNLAFVLMVLAFIPILWDNAPFRKYGLMVLRAAFPFIAGWLLVGGFRLVTPVPTNEFGGIMLTFVIGVTGIAFSPADRQ